LMMPNQETPGNLGNLAEIHQVILEQTLSSTDAESRDLRRRCQGVE